VNDPQAEVLLEWIEVAIVVQQHMTLLSAESRNHAVDCLPNRKAFGSQETVVSRGRNCKSRSAGVEDRQGFQVLLHSSKLTWSANPLKDLTEN
jgi:hypothetical protein